MASLKLDQIIFGFGLTGTLLFVYLTWNSAFSDSGPPFRCWTPAQFSKAHIAYTHAACGHEAARYRMVESTVPLPVDMTSFRNNTANEDAQWLRMNGWAFSFILYSVQAFLLCFAFFILFCITTSLTPVARNYVKEPRDSADNAVVTTAGAAMISYVLTYAVAAFVLVCSGLVSGLKSLLHQVGTSCLWALGAGFGAHSTDVMFLCDYQIRHQARVHRYVIQCIKNVEPAESDLMRCVGYLNAALCLLLVVMVIVHLVTLIHNGVSAGRRNLQSHRTEAKGPESVRTQAPAISILSDTILVVAVANHLPN